MKTYTVTEKLGKDLKVGDEIWWDDENKFIAITEEYLKEALAFAKEEVEKSTYLVRTSIPQNIYKSLEKHFNHIRGQLSWVPLEDLHTKDQIEGTLKSLKGLEDDIKSIPQQDKWKEAQLKLCEILNDKVIHPHINSDMEQLISTMEIEYKDGWQPIN